MVYVQLFGATLYVCTSWRIRGNFMPVNGCRATVAFTARTSNQQIVTFPVYPAVQLSVAWQCCNL